MEQLIENENLIFLPFFFLSLLVLILAVLAWSKFRKLTDENKSKQNRHVQPDDIPGRYMEILDCEQPFVEYY